MCSSDLRVTVKLLNRKKGSMKPFLLFKLNNWVLNFRPDIIHCHESNILKYIFFHRKYKSVLTVHATHLTLIGAHMYKRVIAISSSVQRELQERKIDSIIIGNGIDYQKFKCVNNVDNGSDNCFRIIQIGRLNHNIKGQDIALKALFLLKDVSSYNYHLDFIGEGESYEYLSKMVESLSLNTQVRFLGAKDRSYIYENLCKYNLLIQPSYYEGFGLTIVEGMLAGIPVLVSNTEGPKEIIADGKNGFTFNLSDSNDLAEKIKKISEEYSECNVVAQKGREYAISNYTLNAMLQKYDELYQSLF